jgi:hypothetical protein
MVIGKIGKQLFEIVRYAEHVGFSSEKGWFCICSDFETSKRRQQHVKWIPASTRFEWIREFNFTDSI